MVINYFKVSKVRLLTYFTFPSIIIKIGFLILKYALAESYHWNNFDM